jgi:hypothetical protein
VSVAIRKNTREESLRKRRMGGGDAGEDECSAARDDALVAEHGASLPGKLSELPAMLAALQGSDREGRVMGARALRKLLLRVSDPPVAEVLSAGALPLLCAALGDFFRQQAAIRGGVGADQHRLERANGRAGARGLPCLPVLAPGAAADGGGRVPARAGSVVHRQHRGPRCASALRSRRFARPGLDRAAAAPYLHRGARRSRSKQPARRSSHASRACA